MKKISVSIGGIGSAKCTNIFTQPYKAPKITDGLSDVISPIGAKIGAVVWRPHWLSNKGYLRGGSNGELIWRLICGLKLSTQYFLSYLKPLTSLKGLSAINLSWLRSIKRHNKPLSSSLSSLVAYPLLAFAIVTITACAGGGGGGGTSGVDVDVDGDGLIEIRTAAQLKLIHKDLNGKSLNGNSFGCGGGTDSAGNTITGCKGYELMANISLATEGNWDPIGSCTADNKCDNSFNAIFEGNGFTISNITIELNTPTNGVGFFAAISGGSKLRNVTLDTVDITLSGSGTYTDVGGLVGYTPSPNLIVNSNAVNIVIKRPASVTIISVASLVGDQGNGKSRDGKGGAITVVDTNDNKIANRAPIVSAIDLNVTGTTQDAVASIGSTYVDNTNTFTAYAYITDTDATDDKIEVTFITKTPLVCNFDVDGKKSKKSEKTISTSASGQVHLASLSAVIIKDTDKCIITATAVKGRLGASATYTGIFPDTAPILLPVGTDNVINVSAGSTATVTINVTKTDPGRGAIMNNFPTATGCNFIITNSANTPTGVGVGDIYTIAEYTVSHDAGLLGGSCSFTVTAEEDGNSTIPTIPPIKVNFNPRKVDTDGDGLIEIYTADDLNMIRANLTGKSLAGNSAGCPTTTGCRGYELMANISLVAAGGYNTWEPIGSCTESGTCDNSFDAIFEGNGFTISNITIALSSSTPIYGVGFFAAISTDSELRNLVLGNVNISLSGDGYYRRVGSLVGHASNALIVNSSVVNTTIKASSTNGVGGLVGYAESATINSSYTVVASINGVGRVGGLVGDGTRATITSSYAVVDSLNGARFVGVLVGYGESATINSSYAVVNSISGHDAVGGLVGHGTRATITSSYAVVASISGSNKVGGLVGDGTLATITSSYAVVGSINGVGSPARVGGLVGYGSAIITSSYAVVGSINGSGSVGGLVGFGEDANIASSYALTLSLTGTRNTSEVDGLIGSISSGTTVNSSYWLEGVSYIIGGASATMIRPPFTTTRTATNSGESQTAGALRSGTGIYLDWATAWCDPTTGVFTTDSNSPLATNANLAWNFMTDDEYPALNCLTENITLANQRKTGDNVLTGELPLDDIDRNRLNQ